MAWRGLLWISGKRKNRRFTIVRRSCRKQWERGGEKVTSSTYSARLEWRKDWANKTQGLGRTIAENLCVRLPCDREIRVRVPQHGHSRLALSFLCSANTHSREPWVWDSVSYHLFFLYIFLNPWAINIVHFLNPRTTNLRASVFSPFLFFFLIM